jgi:hypothetical protein
MNVTQFMMTIPERVAPIKFPWWRVAVNKANTEPRVPSGQVEVITSTAYDQDYDV